MTLDEIIWKLISFQSVMTLVTVFSPFDTAISSLQNKGRYFPGTLVVSIYDLR